MGNKTSRWVGDCFPMEWNRPPCRTNKAYQARPWADPQPQGKGVCKGHAWAERTDHGKPRGVGVLGKDLAWVSEPLPHPFSLSPGELSAALLTH